jgi:hypothetical protein
MRKLFLIGVLVGLLTLLTAPAGAAERLSVQVAAEPARIDTVLGGRFMITTELTNTGAAPTGEILAHRRIGRRAAASNCPWNRAKARNSHGSCRQ